MEKPRVAEEHRYYTAGHYEGPSIQAKSLTLLEDAETPAWPEVGVVLKARVLSRS